MSARSNVAAEVAERKLTITRIFNAPRSLVFQAWTDPKHVAKWWGPNGFTNPVCEMDVRPGGALRIVMHSPEGVDYPMTGVFREIVKPERLVFTSAALDAEGNRLLEGLTTVTFVPQRGGKTKLTLETSAVALIAEAARMLDGMEEGWTQTLERLAEYVTWAKGDSQTTGTSDSESSADRELVITRIFDAPRNLVWKAWTDPESLIRWWGPHGFETQVSEMDIRAGGKWRFRMRSPEGIDGWQQGVYREIVEPERLVFSYAFADETGKPGHETLVTVSFAEHGGQTRLTVHHAVFETAAVRDDHVWGWGETLDRLAACAANV